MFFKFFIKGLLQQVQLFSANEKLDLVWANAIKIPDQHEY